MKRLLLSLLLTISILGSAFAQDDSPHKQQIYVFQFVRGNDMFFVPYKGNDISLKEFYKLIKEYKPLLDQGKMCIFVESYATTGNDNQTPSQVAHTQRNRVKSELITCGGATEEMFVTDKYIAKTYGRDKLRNVIVVTIPASIAQIIAIAGEQKAEKVKQYYHDVKVEKKTKADAIKAEQRAIEQKIKQIKKEKQAKKMATQKASEKARQAELSRLQARQAELSRLQAIEDAKINQSLSVRANLLRWATLTPDLGAEYMFNDTWSIVAHGTWTSIKKDNYDRRYAMWQVSPEVRYHLGENKNWYAGVAYQIGEFDYKLSETGSQGDYYSMGLVGGYKLELNKSLSLDLGLGLGYSDANFEKYNLQKGVRVSQSIGTRNYWGINQWSITLSWRLF